MNTLNVEGWYQPAGATEPVPLEHVRFHISKDNHLLLERAEEELHRTEADDKLIPVDLDDLQLELPSECGPVENCQLRVYLSPVAQRGHFHFVGRRASDQGLVYSNAVMIDQLG